MKVLDRHSSFGFDSNFWFRVSAFDSIRSAPLRLPIYLDHNATTPVDERVFEAMRPFFCETFGNAASRGHSFGWAAQAAVDRARQQCAAILNANPNAIVWTSGSTEANNLAIKGVACAHKD